MSGRIVYLSEVPLHDEQSLFGDYPDVMGAPQVAKALGVSEATVRREIRSGRLKSFHAGTRVLVTKTALLEYVGEVVSG